MSEGGTVVLVTGATDGIGRETALELARRGARVIVHGRSAARVEAVTREVRAIREGAALAPLVLDFAHLAPVRDSGPALDALGVDIDVLVNNAGVFMREPKQTDDGFEVTFAVNHLAPFALTHALLRASCGRALRRIVNVSSMAHGRGRIVVDHAGEMPRRFDGYSAYGDSKLANILFTVELARRLASATGEGPRPTVNSLHPGVVSTKLLTSGFGMQGSESLAEGAATSVFLALDPSVETTTGAYFNACRKATPSAPARDPELARRLYDKSAELAGVAPLPG